MATVTKKNAHNLPDPGFGGTAYGTMFNLAFSMLLASGVFSASDKATALIATDKVILGKIPAGTKLLDMIASITVAFTATSTFTIGFEYCDGVDDADVPQDADYFCAAQAASSTALFRKTNVVAPVTLPKDAYLILTNNTATQATSGRIDIEVIGQIGGPQ